MMTAAAGYLVIAVVFLCLATTRRVCDAMTKLGRSPGQQAASVLVFAALWPWAVYISATRKPQ